MQVAHVRKACVDELVCRRLPAAVVVVGYRELEIQAPRADLRAPGLEVVVREQG